MFFFLSNNSIAQISFSGSSKVNGLYSFRSNDQIYSPQNYLRWNLNSTLSLWGIPVSSHLLLTTEQDNSRQDINKFRIYLNYRQILKNKIAEKIPVLRVFKNLEIGKFNPNYSRLVLNGVMVSGINVEINPGLFYAAFAKGRSRKYIAINESNHSDHQQNLIFGRIGIGERQGSHLHFSYLEVKDELNPDLDENPESPSPVENYVVSADARLNFLKKKLFVEGEYAVSLYSRDLNSPDLELDEIPDWLTKIYTPRIGTHYDFAFLLNSGFIHKSTNITGTVKKINPGFNSLGTSFLRKDVFEYGGKIRQGFFKRKFSLTVFLRQNRDNLADQKSSTTQSTSYGITANLKLKDLPSLTVSYAPNYQVNNSLYFNYENNIELFTTRLSYYRKINDVGSQTGFSFSSRTSHRFQTDMEQSFENRVYSLNESLSFSIPLNISTNISLNDVLINDTKEHILIMNLFGTYGKRDKWRNSIGLTYFNKFNTNNKAILTLRTNVPLGKIGVFELEFNQVLYKDQISEALDYNESIVRISLISSW